MKKQLDIRTLDQCPQLYEETIKLIEEAFQYNGENNFAEDFALLMNKSNWKNIYLLLNNSKVIGHIGVYNCRLNLNNLPISMLGGISLDPKYRKKGLFAPFFNSILKKTLSDTCLNILWGEDFSFYEHFGFIPCGGIHILPKSNSKNSTYEKILYKDLNTQDQKTIQELHKKQYQNWIGPKRTLKDWETIKEIKSANFFIHREKGKITKYCVMGKGQDLPNIIHEWAPFSSDFSSFGDIMTPENFPEREILSMALIRPGYKFAQFVHSWCQIDIQEFTQDYVKIQNQNKTHTFPMSFFLQGLLGPNPLSQFNPQGKKIFFSGLDSI